MLLFFSLGREVSRPGSSVLASPLQYWDPGPLQAQGHLTGSVLLAGHCLGLAWLFILDVVTLQVCMLVKCILSLLPAAHRPGHGGLLSLVRC